MIAKWLAHNKVTDVDEYIEVPLLSGVKINENMTQFKVSNFTVIYDDFLDYELPFAWQEIQLVEDEEINYIFYFKSLTAPKFKTNNETIKLKLSLYSTRDLLAHRNRTVETSGPLNDVIEEIIGDVLTSDGYTIVTNTVDTFDVQATYIKQSIETILNDLGNTYEFVWYCDGLKNIYLQSISSLKNATPDLTIDDTAYDNYGYQIQPSITTTDYNNIVELKNVMVLTELSYTEPKENALAQSYGADPDETILFNYKVWSSLTSVQKVSPSGLDTVDILTFEIYNDDFTGFLYYKWTWNEADGFVMDDKIGLLGIDDDDPDKLFLLVRDNDNQNVIIGYKYVGDIYRFTRVGSDNALLPYSFTYYDAEEIESIQPYTNTSGRLEKSIDLYNKYLSYDEMTAMAKGNLSKTNSTTDEVIITMEVKDKTEDYPEIKLADTIYVNVGGKVGSLIGSNSFVVTDMKMTETTVRKTYVITCKNINYNQTYIDLYRSVKIQDNEEQLKNAVSILVKDTIVNERVIVDVDGDVINES